VRDFTREDVDKRLKWEPDTSPFLRNLNLHLGLPEDRDRWLEQRLSQRNTLWFAVDDEQGRMIGDLSLRNISWAEKTATLGIVLGKQYRGRGYGTEAVKLLKQYAFDILGFKALTLEAAAHNKAAIRCYSKCGFVECGNYWGQPVPLVDPEFLEDENYSKYWKYFRSNPFSVLEVFYHRMRATNERFAPSRR